MVVQFATLMRVRTARGKKTQFWAAAVMIFAQVAVPNVGPGAAGEPLDEEKLTTTMPHCAVPQVNVTSKSWLSGMPPGPASWNELPPVESQELMVKVPVNACTELASKLSTTCGMLMKAAESAPPAAATVRMAPGLSQCAAPPTSGKIPSNPGIPVGFGKSQV